MLAGLVSPAVGGCFQSGLAIDLRDSFIKRFNGKATAISSLFATAVAATFQRLAKLERYVVGPYTISEVVTEAVGNMFAVSGLFPDGFHQTSRSKSFSVLTSKLSKQMFVVLHYLQPCLDSTNRQLRQRDITLAPCVF
jgi:hypothetical protein